MSHVRPPVRRLAGNRSARAAADRRITVCWLTLGRAVGMPVRTWHEVVHPTPSVVHPDQERPQWRVPDHGQRAGIGLDPLTLVEVQSQAIGDDGLDDISVRADEIGSVLTEPGIPVPDRSHRPVLHVRHGLAVRARERHRARVGLDHAPKLLAHQLLQRLAGPVPVAALPHPVLGEDLLAVPGRRDRRRGLLAAIQRAADDGVERQRGQPGRQGRCLGLTAIVERDAGRPSGQHVTGRRGEPVADQKNGCHASRL